MTATKNSTPDPKWAALINDTLYPMPWRKMTARDILDQCGAPPATRLVRDRGTADDGGFEDDDIVDLSEGNVFTTTPGDCGKPDRDRRGTPAKLAFSCDDAWEVTLVPKQTGHSLKRLLGIEESAELFRDLESPEDILIQDADTVLFGEGCVFRARKHACPPPEGVVIIVNTREYPVKQRVVSYDYIVSLAFPNPDYENVIYTVKYTDGVPPKTEGSMSRGDKVKVKNGTTFNVSDTDKS